MHPTPLSLLLLALSAVAAAQPPRHPILPSDALSLLSFKSKADLDRELLYSNRLSFCNWQGVKCVQNRVVRFNLQSSGLRGTLSSSLNRLDQLRVLSLRNNSLSGPIPDLSGLINLKTLFLDRNLLSGSLPASILSIRTLLFLDLSHNNLTGSVPVQINSLDLLTYLRIDFNHFTGQIPPLNQTGIKTFNASNNNFTGAIPVTVSISRFGVSSFANNPNLCGEIIHVECGSNSTPPFSTSSATSPPSPPVRSAAPSPPFLHKHKRVGIVLGIILGSLILITCFLCICTSCKSLRAKAKSKSKSKSIGFESGLTETQIANTEAPEITKSKKIEVKKSGKLIFCEDEGKIYTLEELMTASAELLGRGTIGSTYKAVMGDGVTVSVKRLDSAKTAVTNGIMFDEHMEMVGALRHPNLVPVRAYFKAKEERLIVYDYQTNGSLFNLIHGSRSTRAKPLHWTSCLKIADDVAQGLAYIHQASRLIHGNLKSTNVLLGTDFEACLTDYCLSTLNDPSSITLDLDSEQYRAPEICTPAREPTPKSDVYSFGVLILELLSGKRPSQHPYLDPMDMLDWVRAMRVDDDVDKEDRLGMLVEVVSVCSLITPEQRPSTRQVLKMIQHIKERVVVEDDPRNG